jgi:hypothetical protein
MTHDRVETLPNQSRTNGQWCYCRSNRLRVIMKSTGYNSNDKRLCSTIIVIYIIDCISSAASYILGSRYWENSDVTVGLRIDRYCLGVLTNNHRAASWSGRHKKHSRRRITVGKNGKFLHAFRINESNPSSPSERTIYISSFIIKPGPTLAPLCTCAAVLSIHVHSCVAAFHSQLPIALCHVWIELSEAWCLLTVQPRPEEAIVVNCSTNHHARSIHVKVHFPDLTATSLLV